MAKKLKHPEPVHFERLEEYRAKLFPKGERFRITDDGAKIEKFLNELKPLLIGKPGVPGEIESTDLFVRCRAKQFWDKVRPDLVSNELRNQVVEQLWAKATIYIDAMLVLIDGETTSSDAFVKMKEVLTDLFHFDATYADRRLRSHLTSVNRPLKDESARAKLRYPDPIHFECLEEYRVKLFPEGERFRVTDDKAQIEEFINAIRPLVIGAPGTPGEIESTNAIVRHSAKQFWNRIRPDLLDDNRRQQVLERIWAEATIYIDPLLALIDGKPISSDALVAMKEVLTNLFHFDATFADQRLCSHLTSMDRQWKDE